MVNCWRCGLNFDDMSEEAREQHIRGHNENRSGKTIYWPWRVSEGLK